MIPRVSGLRMRFGRSIVPGSLALATLLAAPGAARADSTVADLALQARLFGKPLSKERVHACFRRVYDKAHLAQHPNQNVRTMVLLVSGSAIEGKTDVNLSLMTTFRTKGVDVTVSGGCGQEAEAEAPGAESGAAHCGVDCEGGSIDIALKEKGQVLVTIPHSAGLGTEAGAKPDAAVLRRQFAADDKVFLLDRTGLDQCLPLAGDDDRPAMRRGQ